MMSLLRAAIVSSSFLILLPFLSLHSNSLKLFTNMTQTRARPYRRPTRGFRNAVREDIKEELRAVDAHITESFSKIPLVISFRGSIFPHVIIPIIFFSIYSSAYSFFGTFGILPDLGSTLIPILSMVTGLMVSFRTSSAYERWTEGRRLWETIHTLSRNFNLTFIVGTNSHADEKPLSTEIRAVMRLPIAFAIAVKHHLREENGIEYEDLHGYLPEQFTEKCKLRDGSDNLPLEILMLLQRHLVSLRDNRNLEPSAFSVLNSYISQMVEMLGSAERILSTPIPLSYAIHLKQMIALYCLSLPPQLVGTLGIWSIPVTCIATFTFFGIDALGNEIENPFGYDTNDLPLDSYCREMKNELESIFMRH